MGTVWAATHTVTGKAVALKVLSERSDDPTQRERLVREARAVCAISHPNVVAVHDVLELTDGAPALVMDLLEGESLRAKLDRDGPLTQTDVLDLTVDVLSALEAAHARGIVHRDLKPDNIFLARRPAALNPTGAARAFDVKVLDFGIAKVTTLTSPHAAPAGAEDSALTRTGAMVGTPYYMAPEQVYGERDVDARCDLWSVGVLMYECLAGTRPTEAANLGQIFKLITVGPFPPLASKAPLTSAATLDAVSMCLARKPAERPVSATALRARLEQVRAGGTMHGTALTRDPPHASNARRHKFGPRSVAWVVVGLAGIGACVTLGITLRLPPAAAVPHSPAALAPSVSAPLPSATSTSTEVAPSPDPPPALTVTLPKAAPRAPSSVRDVSAPTRPNASQALRDAAPAPGRIVTTPPF
jgi:serine/threonine-protein kinase